MKISLSAPSMERFLKKGRQGFFFCLVIFSLTRAGAEEAEKILVQKSEIVLAARIEKILEFRIQYLSQCDFQTHLKFYEAQKNLQSQSDSKQRALGALNLYLESQKVSPACRQVLDRGEMNFHQEERKKFSSATSFLRLICSKQKSVDEVYEEKDCRLKLGQLLAELDPHCVSLQVPNPRGFVDPFPCMAGDTLLGRELFRMDSSEELISEIQLFFLQYWKDIKSAEVNSKSIDLFSSFLRGRPNTVILRKKFLSVMTLLLSSTNSYSSYIRGAHDYFWRAQLLESGSSEQALNFFIQSRLVLDRYLAIEKERKKKKVKVFWQGLDISSLNRHDWMASFLSCHYSPRQPHWGRWIPLMMGYGYESLDFVSHRREGDTWDVARENFERDTSRYRQGVKLGAQFCRSTSN